MWLDNYYVYSWVKATERSYNCPNGLPANAYPNVTLPKAVYTTIGIWDTAANLNRYDQPQIVSPLAPPVNGVYQSTTTTAHNNYNYLPNLVIGTGTTPVTPSDYQMEAEIYENLTCSSVVTLRDANAGIIAHTKTMQYSGQDPITVSELGLVVYFNGVGNLLIYREVLDEPIVVNSGETFSVTIKHQLPVISWN